MSSIELSRLRAQLRLVINRLKLLQQKKSALAKQSRRNIADVLKAGKVENAKIRIENIIQEDIYVELLELLEVYCELTLARCAMISGGQIHDDRLTEAITVLIYAAQYSDIKELQTMKPLFAYLISKEFVLNASEDPEGVPPRVMSRIHIKVPSQELVDLYLVEIAKAYHVEVPGLYKPPAEDLEDEKVATDSGAGDDSAGGESAASSSEKANPEDLWSRFAALKK